MTKVNWFIFDLVACMIVATQLEESLSAYLIACAAMVVLNVSNYARGLYDATYR